MKKITSEIIIHDTPSNIWKVLIDFEKYPQWNTFIISLQGKASVNNNLKVVIKPVDKSVMTFRPKVLKYIENKEICWEGNLLIKGLFDGKHSFKLIDNNNGTTIFVQSESFSGILVPLFTRMIEYNTLEGFKLMNNELKSIVEKKASNN